MDASTVVDEAKGGLWCGQAQQVDGAAVQLGAAEAAVAQPAAAGSAAVQHVAAEVAAGQDLQVAVDHVVVSTGAADAKGFPWCGQGCSSAARR